MKDFILTQKKDEDAVIEMVKAMQAIEDTESMRGIIGMKEIIFYYIILNMFKESLLDRLYTHALEYVLDGAKSSLPDPDKRSHIDEAVKSLQRYPLTATSPGICIIISMNIDRPGAEKDVIAVKSTFQKHFNFEVFVKINPTKEDVKKLISNLGESRHKFYDR